MSVHHLSSKSGAFDEPEATLKSSRRSRKSLHRLFDSGSKPTSPTKATKGSLSLTSSLTAPASEPLPASALPSTTPPRSSLIENSFSTFVFPPSNPPSPFSSPSRSIRDQPLHEHERDRTYSVASSCSRRSSIAYSLSLSRPHSRAPSFSSSLRPRPPRDPTMLISLLTSQNTDLSLRLQELEEDSKIAEVAGRKRLRKLEREIRMLKGELEDWETWGKEKEEEEKVKQEIQRESAKRITRETDVDVEQEQEDEVNQHREEGKRSMKGMDELRLEEREDEGNITVSHLTLCDTTIKPESSPSSPMSTKSHLFPSSIAHEPALVSQLLAKIHELEHTNSVLSSERDLMDERLIQAQEEMESLRENYEEIERGLFRVVSVRSGRGGRAMIEGSRLRNQQENENDDEELDLDVDIDERHVGEDDCALAESSGSLLNVPLPDVRKNSGLTMLPSKERMKKIASGGSGKKGTWSERAIDGDGIGDHRRSVGDWNGEDDDQARFSSLTRSFSPMSSRPPSEFHTNPLADPNQRSLMSELGSTWSSPPPRSRTFSYNSLSLSLRGYEDEKSTWGIPPDDHIDGEDEATGWFEKESSRSVKNFEGMSARGSVWGEEGLDMGEEEELRDNREEEDETTGTLDFQSQSQLFDSFRETGARREDGRRRNSLMTSMTGSSRTSTTVITTKDPSYQSNFRDADDGMLEPFILSSSHSVAAHPESSGGPGPLIVSSTSPNTLSRRSRALRRLGMPDFSDDEAEEDFDYITKLDYEGPKDGAGRDYYPLVLTHRYAPRMMVSRVRQWGGGWVRGMVAWVKFSILLTVAVIWAIYKGPNETLGPKARRRLKEK